MILLGIVLSNSLSLTANTYPLHIDPNWVLLTPLEQNASQSPGQRGSFQLHCVEVLLVEMCFSCMDVHGSGWLQMHEILLTEHMGSPHSAFGQKNPKSIHSLSFSFRKWRVSVYKTIL